MSKDLFRAYTELPTRVPSWVWQAVPRRQRRGLPHGHRHDVRPSRGGPVRLLPGDRAVAADPVLRSAPGLWRNVCPLAATNQIPRVLGFGRARAVRRSWLRKRGYLIAVAGFFGIAGARLAGLDRNGAAMGPCSSRSSCPAVHRRLGVQGQERLVQQHLPAVAATARLRADAVRHRAQRPLRSCVGCAKNCYDFRPRAAYQADMADPDARGVRPRKLFVAALPGFVLGFFILTGQAIGALPQTVCAAGRCSCWSPSGCSSRIDAMTPLSPAMLAAGVRRGGAEHLLLVRRSGPDRGRFTEVTGVDAAWLRWPVTCAVAVLDTAVDRSDPGQRAAVRRSTTGARTEPVLLRPPTRRSDAAGAAGSAVAVRFEPDGDAVAADVGMSLLDVAEKGWSTDRGGLPDGGVRGGPGRHRWTAWTCLSAPEKDELNTVRRLGLGKSTRMACCARI